MELTLLYFDGCPSWQLMDTRLRAALAQLQRSGQEVLRREVTTPELAQQLKFRGSPTLLVDGEDPFADPDAPVGLSCRVYRSPDGLTGAPSVADLVAVLR